MKKNKEHFGLLTIIVLSTFVLMWSGFILADIGTNTKEQTIYNTPDPIYETVDQIVIKDIYRQETPIVPVKKTGKEVILLDKSGSMKDFVTELYMSNISFFTNNDVWAFDTEISKDIKVEEIEFGGNTNLIKALNIAAEQGYDTIWVCSDLEQNVDENELSDATKGINVIVYAPKPLEQEKTQDIIQALKKQECHVKVIMMS